MDATTLPTLLLGGDPSARPDETYAAWARRSRCRRSAASWSGRTMLYPADDDVAKAVDTAVSLVRHELHDQDDRRTSLLRAAGGRRRLRARGDA